MMFKFFSLSFVYAIIMSVSAHAETLTLRADVWCPHNCDPKSDHPGYMIEIAKAAFEAEGHKVEYATLNWARAISETREGKYTAIVGAAKSDAEDFIFPSTSMGISQNCMFAKPDSSWTYKDLSSLDSIVLGVIKDYSYGVNLDPYIKANEKNAKKVDVVSGDNPLELNLKKLAAGRIGAFVEADSVIKNYFYNKNKSTPDATVKNVGCIVDADDLYVAFSPKNPKSAEYAQTISKKVEAMRKDGSLKKLLANYGIDDWNNKKPDKPSTTH